ncbi:MAG TPA: universal stress protein [Chitinophagaceae bacterium]|nr:universal stress protein [Chitinophagaceae bacterium]
MKNILVPTDFSDDARNASHFAARLAEKMQASITLLHAYMLPTPVSEVPYVMLNAEEMQKENEELAQAEAQKLQSMFKVQTKTVVRLGFPSEEIESLIEDGNVDLVVMGMKGKGTIEKIVGSTTTSTLKKIKKPLLIVPQNAQYNDLKQITYATDLSYDMNSHVYRPLIDLIKLYGSSVNVLHVQKKQDEPKGQEASGQMQLKPVFGDLQHQFHSITDTDVKHGIKSYLSNHPTDLLVMVTHEHNFWERIFGKSHTKEMVYDTHIPLLVLKDKK